MLHPVGKLPAAVYWRRRVLVLLLLVAVLGGGGWLATIGIGKWRAHAATAAAASTTTRPVPTPALELVVPSPAGAQGPSPAAQSTSARPCTDATIGVSVRAPAHAAVGDTLTLQLVVTNTSAAPCLQTLDTNLQEIVLLDAHGTRVWGSADCVAEPRSDARTLTPGQAVSLPIVWDGLTSEPSCAGRRVPPAAGQYVVRGRLGTVVGPDAALTLGQL